MSTSEVAETLTSPDSVPDESNSLVPVPTGTPPVVTCRSRVDELVERYQTSVKKSAKAMIEAAEAVFIADKELDEVALQEFCKRLKLDRTSSQYRKQRKIGENRPRFEPFFERLPNCRNTLYKLAWLEPDKFVEVVTDERFGPSMIEKDVDEILGKTRPGGKGDESVDVDEQDEQLEPDCSIFFGELDTAIKQEVHKKLIQLSHQYEFKCIFSPELVEELGQLFHRPSKRTSHSVRRPR